MRPPIPPLPPHHLETTPASAPGVDDEAEMLKWKHVTRAGVVGCILFGMFAIEHPTPGPEQPAYDYLRIRVKQFPWGKGEKGLFEVRARQEGRGRASWARQGRARLRISRDWCTGRAVGGTPAPRWGMVRACDG